MVNLSDIEVKNRLALLLQEQSTMTLATAENGIAWAAPVYFVNIEHHFYFFSAPESRHIREAESARQAAAAIYAQTAGWQDIRGVQMSGTVQPVGVGIEASRMIAAYLKKFSFVRDFFQPRQPVTLRSFANAFKARFYCFAAQRIFYLDNQVAFGFRQEVALTEKGGGEDRR